MAVELASAYISLIPSAKGMGGNIAKELGAPAEAAGKNIGQTMGKQMSSGIAGPLKGIGAAIGGTFVATKAFDFLGGAVDGASNLAETLSKVRAVFGPASADLEKWASDAATSMGLSRQQALDLAGTFGNMFGQLGIGSDQAASMSKQMGTLAADLASFHNADVTDVIDAQSAAFRGEYDSLQRFIPTINAAAVEQEALRQSGKKSAKALTLQEKALATQTLMMKGAGKATGDFARTSDGVANKQRIQAAQMENLKATIGAGLLPIVSKLTSAFVALGSFVERNKAVIGPLAAVIGGALVAAFAAWAAGAVAAAIPTIAAAAPVLALGAAVAGLAILVIKNWDTITAAFKAAVDFIGGLVSGIINFIKDHWELLLAILTGPIGLAVAFITDHFDQIVEFVKKLPGRIASVASGMWDGIKDAFKGAVNWIIRAWNGLEFKIPGFDPPGPGPKFGGFTLGLPDIPTLHTGGVVPGRPGSDVLALLQAGETVLPVGSGAVSVQNNWTVDGKIDESALAEVVTRRLTWQLSMLRG